MGQSFAMSRYLILAARFIAICGITFLSLFALDVFQDGVPLSEIALGLFIHLIPSFVLLAVFAISWFWPLAGGIAYMALSTAPFFLLGNPLWVNAMLAAPFSIAGLLFVFGAITKPKEVCPIEED